MRIYVMLLPLIYLIFPTPTMLAQVYHSESLEIKALSPSVFVHVSYLQTSEYGAVPCNGLIFMDEGEAIVFDTPNYDSVSIELIDWIETELEARIIQVVPTHFHIDCLGGLEAFHQRGISSLAHEKTIKFAKEQEAPIPQQGFKQERKMRVGNREIILKTFGAGHTLDNIVVYIPDEETLFGGCLVKTLGASKGNLADADLSEWPKTMGRIKSAYPNLQTVIPGHGKSGGTELLDYTLQLFSSH